MKGNESTETHSKIHAAGMFGEERRVHVNASPRPEVAEGLGENAHVPHQEHVIHPRPQKDGSALCVVLVPRQYLRENERGRHSGPERSALVQNWGGFDVAHDRDDLGLEVPGSARVDDGDEGGPAGGSQDANAKLS